MEKSRIVKVKNSLLKLEKKNKELIDRDLRDRKKIQERK